MTLEAGAEHGFRRAVVRRARLEPWPPDRTTVALAAIVVLAAVLTVGRLWDEGTGNSYYAAGVRSMTENWQNFFFVSYDGAGFVSDDSSFAYGPGNPLPADMVICDEASMLDIPLTAALLGALEPGARVSIDKPPLGFWVQVAFVKALGFSGIALLLPQALAAVAAVMLLFHVVRRGFGAGAGLLAALALALTPVNVAAARNNTIDSQLVLVLVLAAWALLHAIERRGPRWLLLSAVLVGLGFNIKMLQAYLVVPAFGAAYLFGGPSPFRARLLHLGTAAVVLAGVSLSWAVAVDATPAGMRPYVGSSTNNSVMELITGHNGIRRLLRRAPGVPDPAGPPPAPLGVAAPTAAGPPAPPPSRLPAPGPGPGRPPQGSPIAPPRAPAPGPTDAETGARAPLRLFNRQLGGQAGWLLLPSLVGLIVAWGGRPLHRVDRRRAALLLWGGWLLTAAVFFSAAALFHRYYLSMLGPPEAALIGAGAAALWRRHAIGGRRAWLAVAVVAVALAVECALLEPYVEWRRWLWPLIVVTGIAGEALLMAGALRRRPKHRHARLRPAAGAALAACALFAAPLAWSTVTMWRGVDAALPYAGPGDAASLPAGPRPAGGPPVGGRAPAGPGRPPGTAALTTFLLNQRHGETFLVAVPNAMTGSALMLETGVPVMALGGFSGADRILDREGFERQVTAGEVRFVLSQGPGGPGVVEIDRWVRARCREVPRDRWDPAAAAPGPLPGAGSPPGAPLPGGAPRPGEGPGRPPAFPPAPQGPALFDCRATDA